MVGELTFDAAKKLEGTSFWVYPERDQKVELRVIEVLKVMESEAARLKRHPFSIYFLGPASYRLQQGTFLMSHDAFPEPFDLFVVPIGERPEGFVYEAVFA